MSLQHHRIRVWQTTGSRRSQSVRHPRIATFVALGLSRDPIFYFLALALVVAQFALPRRLAFLPLLIAACHFQNVPVIELGAASFTLSKLVILAGLLRAACNRTLVWSSHQPLDMLLFLWATWTILSGFAHNPKDYNPITLRLSWVYDIVGAYLYTRAFLKDPEDYLRFAKSLALVLTPLACLVLSERVTGTNSYGALTGFMEQAAQLRPERASALRAPSAIQYFSEPSLQPRLSFLHRYFDTTFGPRPRVH